jgi:pimeloyl-ACP methyl ester carboxylesterase
VTQERVLATYEGEKPPAPSWFTDALAVPFETVPLVCDGASLELLCWGTHGAPGLLLLHGNRAHARWWTPIAAMLAAEFRVAALSWSGMGGSEWRSAYSLEGFADEAIAAAQAAGLFDARPPVIVAHSFGGGPALIAAQRHGHRFAGLIILDTQLSPGPDKILVPPTPRRRVQKSITEALSRFRLVPPQGCTNHFYLDWIARGALREVPSDAPEGPGFVWSFDPEMWDKLIWSDRWAAAAEARCPLAFVDGELSLVSDHESRRVLRSHVPAETQFESIADAAHHLMLDQPIATVAAIRRLAHDLQHDQQVKVRKSSIR